MSGFETRAAGVVIGPDDRIRVQYRTVCVGCGAEVKTRTDRLAHACPEKK